MSEWLCSCLCLHSSASVNMLPYWTLTCDSTVEFMRWFVTSLQRRCLHILAFFLFWWWIPFRSLYLVWMTAKKQVSGVMIPKGWRQESFPWWSESHGSIIPLLSPSLLRKKERRAFLSLDSEGRDSLWHFLEAVLSDLKKKKRKKL